MSVTNFVKRIDLETGEQTIIEDAALARHLTYKGKRCPPLPGPLWQMMRWDESARRFLPAGFLVTSNRSAKDPSKGSGFPRPVVAFWAGGDRLRWIAREVAGRNELVDQARQQNPNAAWAIDSEPDLIRRVAGILLIPLRRNGKTPKLSSLKFPGAIYGRYRGVLAFHSLTHAEVEHLIQWRRSLRVAA